jgi:hypothetical protein
VPDGPPQLELYVHGTDPGEFVNLADRAEHAARRDAMVSELLAEWDPAAIQRGGGSIAAAAVPDRAGGRAGAVLVGHVFLRRLVITVEV